MVAAPGLFAQSAEPVSKTESDRALIEIAKSTLSDNESATVINPSTETLRQRLYAPTPMPGADQPLKTIESRASSSPMPAPQGISGESKYRFTPYVWMAGLQGDVGAQGRVVHVNAPFLEVIDEVNFGFAAVFEAKLSEKWAVIIDFSYLNLSDDKSTPGPLFDAAQVNIKSSFFSAEGAYKLAGTGAARLDISAGMRAYHQDMRIELRRGATRQEISQGATWVDPIVGLRMRVGGKVFATIEGDIGGFGLGSTFAWHAFGGGGVNIGKHAFLVAGYRYMDVDYRSKDFVYDTAMSGLLIGFGLRF